jgi:hypothetical protein
VFESHPVVPQKQFPEFAEEPSVTEQAVNSEDPHLFAELKQNKPEFELHSVVPHKQLS